MLQVCFVDIKKTIKSCRVHLEPSGVEEELQQGEDGHVEVEVVARVTLGRVEELTTDQTSEEKGVDGESDHLKRDRQRETTMFMPPSLIHLQS